MKYGNENELTWDMQVQHDSNGNYNCSLKTDIVSEKLTQAAFKKVDEQFHYFSAMLNLNEIQEFPDKLYVLGLEHFHFSASAKLGITGQYNYNQLIIPTTITYSTMTDRIQK